MSLNTPGKWRLVITRKGREQSRGLIGESAVSSVYLKEPGGFGVKLPGLACGSEVTIWFGPISWTFMRRSEAGLSFAI
jgi:hypothetical protein